MVLLLRQFGSSHSIAFVAGGPERLRRDALPSGQKLAGCRVLLKFVMFAFLFVMGGFEVLLMFMFVYLGSRESKIKTQRLEKANGSHFKGEKSDHLIAPNACGFEYGVACPAFASGVFDRSF